MTLVRRCAALALLLIFLVPVVFAQTSAKPTPRQYEIVALPLRPLAINGDWVAGATADQRAATWSAKSGLHRISLPAEYSFSECAGINSHGDSIGTASTADSSRRVAFLFSHDKVTLLSGEQSRANGINESGNVVGQAILPDHKATGAVVWQDGKAIDLNICCAGLARRINGQGLVVGDTYDKAGRYHAFVWDAEHGARLLTTPEEKFSSALAINERGEVLLKTTPGGIVLYSAGKFESVDMAKATPRDMNDDGLVVGSFGLNPDEQRAFVWDKVHGLRDLNDLIPANSGWTLEVASGINDRGEIVGWGDHQGTENTGFLLRLK